MTKICSRCKSAKSELDFNWKIMHVKRAVQCKTCSRKYIKSHYDKNRSYYIKKAKKRNIFVKTQIFSYLADYLSSHPCVDCGEKDITVLEFDHKDRETKVEEIAIMLQRRLPINKLIREINKCDVRCANCHRRKTAKENNSWKLIYAPVA